ncbi:hypothetical protein [Allorhodopirellula solitaria]|uniref:Uncharacterized protein n=1 Tax=Allorhodopirellula solitaria TaxID=2527987 RepID=A0A5C5XV44_9BACT|nr:hypothetical protein [Allorhodopirellula solitaria]TWT66369.1 hypothetical protein CA85_24630 [Allorhodopirellula solitaria]
MATLVERIRQALGKRDGISEETMRPLATAYADEVTRVNTRLAEAVALLHKGLRSEGIQVASISPNAIDAAAKLDLPDDEREDWFDILQFLDVPVPPKLERDLVDQLNEAIVETQPLEGLLTNHRRLAIARAPLAWRLKVLRRIAEVDATTPVWEEDIESWEKVRHKQLTTEARAAISAKDPVALKALQDELTQSAWRLPPDPKLTARVSATLTGLTEQDTISQLQGVAAKLNDAFCQFDEPGARSELTRWNELAATLTSPLPQELEEAAEPPILWLREIDREKQSRAQRAAAIGGLEAVLDRKAPVDDLERAYQQTTLFEQPPPDELVQRYQVAIEDRQMTKKRQFLSIIAAVFAATVIAIVAFAWWQIDAAKQARAIAAEQELQSLLDSGDLDGASSFHANLRETDPQLAGTSAIASLNSQVQTAIGQRTQRAEQFADYLAKANADVDAEIDLSALNRAEKLAETDEQKGRVFELRSRYSAWEASIATQQTKELLEELKSTRDTLTELEEGAGGDDASRTLSRILDSLKALPSTFPRAASSALAQVNSVKTRTNSLDKAIRQRRERMTIRDAAMEDVHAAKSLDQLAERLKRSASQLDDASLADEFRRAASERELWDQGLMWNEYANTASKAFTSGLSAESMQSIVSAKSALGRGVDHSLMQLPVPVADRIERFADRTEVLKRVLGGLPNTVVADLYTVVVEDGRGDRYFVFKSYYDRKRDSVFAPSDDGRAKHPGVEVVANDSGAIKTVGLEGNFEIHKEPYASIKALASMYAARGDEFLSDWEGEFLKLIATVRGRDQLDGQIKEMLLQHLLSGAIEGSAYLSKALSEDLRWLEGRSNEIAYWYEPSVPDNSLGPNVEQRMIPKLSRVYQNRPKLDLKSLKLRDLKFDWVGTLGRGDDGSMAVKLNQPAAANGNLAIVRPSPTAPEKADWVPIGRLKSGTVELTQSEADWIAGRPVFLYPNNPDSVSSSSRR